MCKMVHVGSKVGMPYTSLNNAACIPLIPNFPTFVYLIYLLIYFENPKVTKLKKKKKVLF